MLQEESGADFGGSGPGDPDRTSASHQFSPSELEFTATAGAALVLRDQTNRTRRKLGIGAALALIYAFFVLAVAASSGATGFLSLLGSPVVHVEPGSAADKAGMRRGDVITSVNGVQVSDSYQRHRTLRTLGPGSTATLDIARGEQTFSVSYQVGRNIPFGAAAGAALAAALLALALLADRGGPNGPPRSFYRSCVFYVLFLVGTFAFESVLWSPILVVPWLVGMTLAAPSTCHFMLQFPAGPQQLPLRTRLWIWVPPICLALFSIVNTLAFRFGLLGDSAGDLAMVEGGLTVASSAIYLSIGAISRGRRLRRKKAEIDPLAARWLHIGGVVMAVPLVIGTIWSIVDINGLIVGFKPLIAIAMVGGSVAVVLAMARERFGDLDRVLRAGTGHVLANAVAAALYLAIIAVLGGTAAATSGGSFTVALAATFVAAVVFGPLRSRVQRLADDRFARDRTRARRLVREAAEFALSTLDEHALNTGVAVGLRAALNAEGVALLSAVPESDPSRQIGASPSLPGGGWSIVATAGHISLFGDRIGARDPIGARLTRVAGGNQLAGVGGGVLAAPIEIKDSSRVLLVVAPSPSRPLDEEDRDLIGTLVAGLAVAIANARAHTHLRTLSERLRAEVEVAERRRREIARLKERLEEEKQVLEAELTRRGGRAPIIGAGLRPTFELVQKVARSEASVLVFGETGVGKELVARAIHAGSTRRAGPFVVVDCGAIPHGVFESALFGHERGAFTGAVRAAQGAFRAAHGGTIFLDEIGELPLDLQPKLLRVLQEKEVRPVGSDETMPVDVRVVAGTNRDLGAEVNHARFREDLLYRLRVIEIAVPPLRSRKRDIPELCESFLRSFAERRGVLPKKLAPDAMAAMLDHDWPGNVRELEHALEAASVYADGEQIRAGDLPISGELFRKRAERAVAQAGDSGPGLRETLETLERDRLHAALREHGGNRSAAAKSLGLSRGSLLRRLQRYGE